MKLLTFAIPSYNSQDYMEHCILSLLPGGDDVEILIVDDGSKPTAPQRSQTSTRENIRESCVPSIRRTVGTERQ